MLHFIWALIRGDLRLIQEGSSSCMVLVKETDCIK